MAVDIALQLTVHTIVILDPPYLQILLFSLATRNRKLTGVCLLHVE
jgi:hypothetical protein